MPFAVVGSDKEYQVNGKRVLGRKTAWGIVEGESNAFHEQVSLFGFLHRTDVDGFLSLFFCFVQLKIQTIVSLLS